VFGFFFLDQKGRLFGERLEVVQVQLLLDLLVDLGVSDEEILNSNVPALEKREAT
jgi:hypothetical protein